MERKCERCGSCCVQVPQLFDITTDDIRRWIKEGRFDILWYCAGWNEASWDLLLIGDDTGLLSYLNEVPNMEMWFNPDSGDQLSMCPFLRKTRGKKQFECLIHETKPEMCRNYICDPERMMRIVKKPFEENLKEYKRGRRRSPSYGKVFHMAMSSKE